MKVSNRAIYSNAKDSCSILHRSRLSGHCLHNRWSQLDHESASRAESSNLTHSSHLLWQCKCHLCFSSQLQSWRRENYLLCKANIPRWNQIYVRVTWYCAHHWSAKIIYSSSRMSYFSHSNYDTTHGDPDPAAILIPANDNDKVSIRWMAWKGNGLIN